MTKREFIDALYSAGWVEAHDAQHTGAKELHAKIFPTVAKLEDERGDLLEIGHMAGQGDAGIDPSFSNAQAYAKRVV